MATSKQIEKAFFLTISEIFLLFGILWIYQSGISKLFDSPFSFLYAFVSILAAMLLKILLKD